MGNFVNELADKHLARAEDLAVLADRLEEEGLLHIASHTAASSADAYYDSAWYTNDVKASNDRYGMALNAFERAISLHPHTSSTLHEVKRWRNYILRIRRILRGDKLPSPL